MQEFNILKILNELSIEIVIGAVVACILCLIIKIRFKISHKSLLVCSFFIGGAVTYLASFIILKNANSDCLQKAILSGAVAIVLTAFSKKFAFTDKDDLKQGIEKLLSSIVLSEELDRVVDSIIETIVNCNEIETTQIKQIIKENLNDEIDETDLDALSNFILTALKGNKQNEE